MREEYYKSYRASIYSRRGHGPYKLSLENIKKIIFFNWNFQLRFNKKITELIKNSGFRIFSNL